MVGGNLHIVLDDGNAGDGSLDFCGEEIERDAASSEADSHLIAAERRCLAAFRALNEGERWSVLGLFWAVGR